MCLKTGVLYCTVRTENLAEVPFHPDDTKKMKTYCTVQYQKLQYHWFVLLFFVKHHHFLFFSLSSVPSQEADFFFPLPFCSFPSSDRLSTMPTATTTMTTTATPNKIKEMSRLESSTTERTVAAMEAADGSTHNKSGRSFVTVTVDPSVYNEMISIARRNNTMGGGENGGGNGDDGSHQHQQQQRRRSRRRSSQIWCFFVCDLVTACVVMNGIYIVLLVFHLVISLTDSEHFGMRARLYRSVDNDEDDYGEIDDDDYYRYNGYEDGGGERVLDPWGVIRYGKNLVGLAGSVLGIAGAVRFKPSWVLVCGVWQSFYIVLSLANRTWIGTFLTVPFAYTSIHLWVALRDGTITPENYRSTERHCCCCCCWQRGVRDGDDEDEDDATDAAPDR